MENNVFIFHGMIVKLFDGMKLSRYNKYNGSCLNDVLDKVYGYNSFPLFDIDKFDFIMPMQRNLWEVQWNGTQIGVVWKCRVNMFFFIIGLSIKKVNRSDCHLPQNCL